MKDNLQNIPRLNSVSLATDDPKRDVPFINPLIKQQPQHSNFLKRFFMSLEQEVQTCDRKIYANGDFLPENFITNKENNRKYTLFSFLPKFLFEQYKVFANFYYLMITVIQFYPPYRIGFLFSYICPLLIVNFFSLAKEIWDERKRIRKDQEINDQLYIQMVDGKEIEVKSEDIKIGHQIKLKKNQRAPADLIILSTTDAHGRTYVKTDQLDGETDWKIRSAVKYTQNHPHETDFFVILEPPNPSIHSFNGSFHLSNLITYEQLSLENTIWANMKLVSGEAICLVGYVGKETRSSQNI